MKPPEFPSLFANHALLPPVARTVLLIKKLEFMHFLPVDLDLLVVQLYSTTAVDLDLVQLYGTQ